MSWSGLTTCVCGHVANHHSVPHGCHVRGCPCRAFDAGSVSLATHNSTVREANRRIRALEAENATLRERLAKDERGG